MKNTHRFLKKILKILLFLVILAAAASAVWKYLLEKQKTSGFVTSFYQIQSEKLSDRMRIALLSDLHLKEYGEKNKDLLERIQQLKPDLIAVAGDMNLEENEDDHVVTELCTNLLEIAPVYYVMGNHEWQAKIEYGQSIVEDIEATGVNVLNDRWEEIEINGNTIKIGGLTEAPMHYEKYGKGFFENFEKEDGFKLLLTHYPEYFLGELENADIDVAMCGHAHGGQVRIPGVGGLYTKDQGWFPKLTEGVQQINGISVVISRGLGDSSEIPRINNPAELVIVDLNWY